MAENKPMERNEELVLQLVGINVSNCGGGHLLKVF